MGTSSSVQTIKSFITFIKDDSVCLDFTQKDRKSQLCKKSLKFIIKTILIELKFSKYEIQLCKSINFA